MSTREVASAARAEHTPGASTGGASKLTLVGWWAVLGLGLTFVEAIVRLGNRAAATLRAGLELEEWAGFALLTLTLTYFEGYRALQRRFVPKVLTRARSLSCSSSWAHRYLAPLYAASLIGAPRPHLLRAWSGVTAIVLAVVLVRMLPAPWRGIVDGAVASALGWGLVALASQAVQNSATSPVRTAALSSPVSSRVPRRMSAP